MANFPYGTMVELKAVLTNPAGAAYDPTTVTFKVKNPAGTVSTYVYLTDPEVVKEATGVYSMYQVCESHGPWYWQVRTTGPVGARQSQFGIEGSDF